jgi:threonine dehydratase
LLQEVNSTHGILNMTAHRRPVYSNPASHSWSAEPLQAAELAENFHQKLKGYQKSPLVSLEGLAKEIGVGAVHVKVETSRLGLPATEILGVSWATFRAVTRQLHLPLDTDIEEVKARLAEQPIPLVAATEGSHGRAVARMGAILTLPVEIHVPAGLSAEAIALIQSEGATVIEANGDYTAAIGEAQAASQRSKGIFIQDVVFDGDEDISQVSFTSYSDYLLNVDHMSVDR